MDLTALIVSIIAIVVSLASVRYTRDQADAAKKVTAIEQQRWNEHLTPQLSIYAACRGSGSDRVRLNVKLDGPDGLDRLDEVAVSVRDDRHRTPVIAGEPTQEQIDATIWGPYRFVPGVDGADKLGRAVPTFALTRGDSRPLEMQPSLAPSWYTPGQWQQDYAEQPIRLEITCVREGNPRWRITREIDQPQPQFTIESRPADHAVMVIARNIGTAPARDVSFNLPSNDPTVVEGDQTPLLEVGHSASAIVYLTAESMATRVELAWTDQLGASHRQPVDLR